MIIDAHYCNLSHLPAATNQTRNLRQCYDNIKCHLRSLEAIGENVNHRHFVALISEKLPQKVLYQLYIMKKDGKEWTVSKLCQLLEKHITALMMAGGQSCFTPASLKPNSRYSQREGSGQSYHLKSTAEGLTENSRNPGVTRQYQDPLQMKCIAVNPIGHDECTKFATLQAQKEKLKGFCFKCLQKGHTLKDCK